MTNLKMLNSSKIDTRFLNVSADHLSAGEQNRTRSERAASLALPHNSLLDFYDKGQEQCNSIALLPTSVNNIVRRHSSHSYPLLAEQNSQQLQQQQQQQRQLENVHEGKTKHSNSLITVMATSEIPVAVAEDSMTAMATPPPVPKRTFREKYGAWHAIESGTAADVQISAKLKQHQHQQQRQQGTAFIYPTKSAVNAEGILFATTHQSLSTVIPNPTASPSSTTNRSPSMSLFVDNTSARPSYSECVVTDADGGISDDDRMSLENSVFDESLTSTPVKATTYNASKYNVGYVVGNFSAKTLAALNGDLSHVTKRSNRSSCSTVDSTTISSGYGSSHSERFASTTSNTTAEYRSRFSSVDTQSSLDSSVLDKAPNDSPLSKVTFKLERVPANETLGNLNNNEPRSPCLTDTFIATANNINNNNNNNINYSRNTTTSTTTSMSKVIMDLPTVPLRKQYCATTKMPSNLSPQKLDGAETGLHNQSTIAKSSSRVSASASSTSTASAGSSMLSGSSMSSISASTSATASINTKEKRPVPPAPPLRVNNSANSIECIKSTLPQQLNNRNRINRSKPPPIVYPKLHQRQDSNLSSDSYSVTSSPGYNSKNLMDAPLLTNATRIVKNGMRSNKTPYESNGMTTSTFGVVPIAPPPRNKFNSRQDSTISSDSFSMTSSPGYNTKIMEAPLLPTLSTKRLCSMPAPVICKQKLQNLTIEELEQNTPLSQQTKGHVVTTPTTLQTIVRFQNGSSSTLPLQQQIITRRKSSNPYITNGRLKFRLFQILINAFALLAIAGGLAAYFNAYPTIKFVNKTIINTVRVPEPSAFGKNPAPGTCLPIIVKFCQGPQIPYNYTVFPNYIGHFGQLETQVDLDAYEALVDVRCYELVSLFLCTLFVPKCGTTGATVPPCKILCTETMRRCGFFFDVFGLNLPEYLNCNLFKDFESPDDCVGLDEVREAMIAAANPKCDGYRCDQNRCIPNEYVCDGHLDCMDQADESNCELCQKDQIYCGDDRCIGKRHVCDGIIDCPYAQDERNCIRLSERNGDLGKGVLEVYRINTRQWAPACVKNWDRAVSPSAVCSMLGYNSVNATSVITQRTHRPLLASVNVSTDIWKMYAKRHSTIMKEFSNCRLHEDYPIAELTCSNYQCGKVKRGRRKPARRIIGGNRVNPGTWPFLAAILGGPEKIFYCAGVLISDQWVLTASHCIGNHTLIDLEDWTIQLGVTRRNSFTYSGQKVKVKTVIPHPQYNTAIAHDNDIALFQLAQRVAFHEHLLPVCLPPPNVKKLQPNQMCTVIGWGKREDKDPTSTYEYIVNEVQVPIIKHNTCDEWLDNLTVSDGMICAGFEEGGKDACQGDSGGPLLCPYPGEKDRWFVGGIVSWGIMCAHPRLPGVYANVTKYLPWIHEQMQKYTKPILEERVHRYDEHPGGPDILSNIATSPIRHKKPFYHQNRSPSDIDYYESDEQTI